MSPSRGASRPTIKGLQTQYYKQQERTNTMEPLTPTEIYEQTKGERDAKLKDFTEQAQDGDKAIVRYNLQACFVELVDVKDLELKYSTSMKLRQENTDKILSNAIGKNAIFAAVNGIDANVQITSVDINTERDIIIAPQPRPEETADATTENSTEEPSTETEPTDEQSCEGQIPGVDELQEPASEASSSELSEQEPVTT